jgi:putative acetyltransferase
MDIADDNLHGTDVLELLQAHLVNMYTTSPPASVHGLDIEASKYPHNYFLV